MTNPIKLKRCLDYLNTHKDEIINNYEYITSSNKEKSLLTYLITLKKKLKEKYNNVTFIPFFIDEYGNHKNLTSSIIEIYFPFDEGNNYKEIYSLIKNYFTYEIFLKKKMKNFILPNISLVFDWKIADCIDLSNIVVSCLRTKNYDAYIICGEAPFSICSKIDKKSFCNFDLKKFQKENDNEEENDIKIKKKKYEKELNIKKNFLSEYEKENKINENDYYVHMWILVKKSLDLKKDIFIEMSSGKEYDIDNCPYKSIFYLWNDKNIYININKTNNIKKLISEIKNKEYFIPAFYEEIKNKTLNPIIENRFYKIRKDRFFLKYPHGCNTTFYENCKKDEYGNLLQHDGLVEMHTHYENDNYSTIYFICSFFKNRKDKKKMKIFYPQKFKTIEYYETYSFEFLKKYKERINLYTYYSFYSNRLDGLLKYFEIKNYKIMEYYKNRNDNIIYRSMKFSENIQSLYKLQSYEGNEYYITKITVKYKNEEKENCIYKKVFLITENKIIIYYYNNENKISNNCDVYEKNVIFNSDRDEYEEILIFKKNSIYKHYINNDKPIENNSLYLLKEENVFFDDMKYIYNNVICSIMKHKKEIKKEEEKYQYASNNITNINEIVYHNNNNIFLLNQDIMEDNLNIYNYYKTYPWNNNMEITLNNNYFKSMQNMIVYEFYKDKIKYNSEINQKELENKQIFELNKEIIDLLKDKNIENNSKI